MEPVKICLALLAKASNWNKVNYNLSVIKI